MWAGLNEWFPEVKVGSSSSLSLNLSTVSTKAAMAHVSRSKWSKWSKWSKMSPISMDNVSNQFRFQQIPNPWVGWTVPFQPMIDSFNFLPTHLLGLRQRRLQVVPGKEILGFQRGSSSARCSHLTSNQNFTPKRVEIPSGFVAKT